MTPEGWKNTIRSIAKQDRDGTSDALELLAAHMAEVDQARQLLRDLGFGVAGTPILDQVRAIPAERTRTTEGEARVLKALGQAWGEWVSLERRHPDELVEFKHHLHLLQMMVAWRVASRADPEHWACVENRGAAKDG